MCVGRHVCDGERAVGRVVEQTLVESAGEEADRWTAVNQRESQQAADVKVQILTQSCRTNTTFTAELIRFHKHGRRQSCNN